MTCRGCEHCKAVRNRRQGQSKFYCDIRSLGETARLGYTDPETDTRYAAVKESMECLLGRGFRKPIEKKESIWGY